MIVFQQGETILTTNSPLPGSTIETAIKLDANCSYDAIQLEDLYLSRKYGLQGRDWHKRMQRLIVCENKHFDLIDIEIGRRTEEVFFDISDAFTKTPRPTKRAHPKSSASR